MSDEKERLLLGNLSKKKQNEPPRIYKRRWLMLLVFSFNTMMSGSLYIGISPIIVTAAKYYHQSQLAIEWLSNAPLVSYILLAFVTTYFMFKKGVRPVLVTAAACNCAATMFRYYGQKGSTYWSLATGQIFTGIGFATTLQIPGELSVKWFPENERAVATALGSFANLLGVALGYIQINHTVPEVSDTRTIHDGFQTLYLSQFLTASVIFLITSACYREEPPTPPTHIKNTYEANFLEEIKMLVGNKNFLLLLQTYAIYYGLVSCVPVILSPWITKVYPSGYQIETGWLGFCYLMSSSLSCYLTGMLLDKFHLHHVVCVALNLLSAVCTLIFMLVLTKGHSFTAVFSMAIALGFFSLPYFSAGIEHAAEITYPVRVVITSTVLLAFGNFYGFLLVILFGYLIEHNYIELAGYAMVALYLFSTLSACLTKTQLRRRQAEQETIELS